MKKQTILITGSAGFIGFHTAKRLLDEGHMVIGIDNFSTYYDVSLKHDRNAQLLTYKNYIFHQTDITNILNLQKVFKKEKIEIIIHLAAQAGVRYSLEKPLIYEEINGLGFLNILECARQFTIKTIIYASSSSVYGDNKMKKDGFKESDDVSLPISLYAATKRANELTAYTYHHLYNIHMTGLRFFTVYGPWGRPDMALYKFAEAISKGKSIDLYNFGRMKRDFTYIDDIVSGIVSALVKSYPYEIINLGNSNPVELKYFVSCIENELKMKAIVNLLPIQAGDVLKTYANIDKAKKILNFLPHISIEEGVASFISWYKNYKKI